ncbi:Amino acid adenylation domain-containing protein [Sulfidibacter corallicola]|uniref:Amino acid adenylation domain-containing protein n=1 Tax=Sulfidibacter corallicola TaxID=2818388 RepID=A0A8A4TG66_SULCO|nr:non-ribosomal peptide synthetase [Sulfidibacter corallicola]QTD48916.1 amino acid adenylation domain-containing protein [Sulfidibacter corallicola]
MTTATDLLQHANTQFWCDRLQESRLPSGAPIDRATSLVIDGDLQERLEARSRANPLARRMILIAVWRACWRRHGISGDHMLAMAPPDAPETGEPVFIALGGDTSISLRNLLPETKKELEQALAHRDYDPDRLRDLLGANRDPQVAGILEFGSSQAEARLQAAWSARFTHAADALRIEIRFQRDPGFSAEAFAKHFRNLLCSALGEPNLPIAELSMLTDETRAELLATSSGPVDEPLIEAAIHQVFADTAIAHGSEPALVHGGRTATYSQLVTRVHGAAQHLRTRYGVDKGDHVAVLMPRSPEAVTAMLAIFSLGAVYVPVDTRYPAARRDMILEDAQPVLVLCGDGTEPSGYTTCPFATWYATHADDPPVRSLETKVAPEDPAYLLFTSGSTGRPKGVLLSHRGFVNMVADQIARLSITAEDRCLAFAPLGFDASLYETFLALHAGAALHLIDDSTKMDTSAFSAYMDDAAITVATLPPAFLASLDNRPFPHLRVLITAGEAPRPAQVAHYSQSLTYINAYGPTEASVCVALGRLSPRDADLSTIPMGTPVRHTRVLILGPDGRLLPPGATGELAISGPGLALQYFGQPEATEKAFVIQPELGARVYLTGDLGRYLPDGRLVFLGRRDRQLKLRGIRIETGELEAALHDLGYADALIQARDGQAWAFALGTGDEAEIRRRLAQRIPDFALPQRVLLLTQWPLTPNGKIDHDRLHAMLRESREPAQNPASEMEQRLFDLWCEVLDEAPNGVAQSFFHAGGDSIKALQVAGRLNESGLRLTVRDFYEAPTIRELALRLRRVDSADATEETGDTISLSPIQRWFFESGREPLHHFNQAVMVAPHEPIDTAALQAAIYDLWAHHDQLRVRFEGEPLRQISGHRNDPPALTRHQVGDATHLDTTLLTECQTRFDLAKGPLIGWHLFEDGQRQRLLVVAHHLVVDGVSWRILLQDLAARYHIHRRGLPTAAPARTQSFATWTRALRNRLDTFRLDRTYWQTQLALPAYRFENDEAPTVAHQRTLGRNLPEVLTRALMGDIHRAYGTDINDLLLTAFLDALHELTGGSRFKLHLEGHGRDESGHVDSSRTVGWFTALYPVVLERPDTDDLAEHLITTKETLRRIPDKGLGYGVLRWLEEDPLEDPQPAQISFNFLGSFDGGDESGPFRLVREPVGPIQADEARRPHRLDLIGWIHEGQCRLELTWHEGDFGEEAISGALAALETCLERIRIQCASIETPVRTPSDFTHADLPRSTVAELCHAHRPVDILPLTPMQQGIYFQSRWSTDATYFEQTAYLLEGPVDVTHCADAVRFLGAHHPVTRTRYVEPETGVPIALVLPEGGPAFRHHHLGTYDPEAVEAYKARDRADRFDLCEGALMRMTLLTFDDNRAWLIWSFHHILMDGWCLGILTHTFFERYAALVEGHRPQLQPDPAIRPYFRWLARRDHDSSHAYWRALLDGATQQTSPVRGPATEAYAWSRTSRRFGQERTAALSAWAADHDISLFNLVQALWSVWLAKFNHAEEVLFGTVVSGRPAEVPAMARMVGLFMNTVPVRVRVDGARSFADLAADLAEQMNAGTPHQQVPLHEILARHPLGRNLFDHILVFENYPVSRRMDALMDRLGLRLGSWESFEQTPYDFNLSFHPGEDLELVFETNANRIDNAAVSAIADQLTFLADQVLADDSLRLDDLALTPRPLILEGPLLGVAHAGSLLDLFETQVAERPEAIAVIDGADHWTYGALDRAANSLAHYLIEAAGVTPRDRVAICVRRTVRMPLAVLAVAKTGAAYVPLDPASPEERLRFIATDCEAILCLVENATAFAHEGTQLDLDDLVLEDSSEKAPPRATQPEDTAYLVYTSGSTGRPKGVCVGHGALANQIAAWRSAYELDATPPVALQVAGFAFDVFTGDLARTLPVGGTLVICDEQVRLDPPALFQLLASHRVTLFEGTPGLVMPLLHWMAEQRLGLPQFRLLIVGSDTWSAADARFARELLPAECRLINSYGVTEATIDTCFFEIRSLADLPETGQVPIGRPLANNHMLVLDRAANPLPTDAVGELFIGGAAVAEGYWSRADLTAQRFRELPELGRSYATGDLARVLPSGDVVFLGRGDAQVKVRGYRIECGEIEAALSTAETVRAAAVIARPDASGQSWLCAYLVSNREDLSEDQDTQALRDHLAAKLPEYMIPARFQWLDQLPLTVNGKIDRAALRLRDEAPLADGGGRGPRHDLDAALWSIFADLLQRDPDRHDIDLDFFQAGGHSLLALRCLGRIRQELAYDLSPRDFFAHSSVAALADLLDERQVSTALPPIVAQPEADHYPVSFSQRRLWILHQMEAVEAYNVPGAFTLEGPLDVARLQGAINATVARHESLRTGIVTVADAPRQMVVPQVVVDLPRIDLSDAADPMAAAREHAYAEANRAFDLGQAPLFRVTLLVLAEQKHLLLFTLHHIIADGWSMDILFRDIGAAYTALGQGTEVGLPPLPFQYRDFAVWFEAVMSGDIGQRQRDFWQTQFADEAARLELPTDRPRPPLKTYRGSSVAIPLPANLMDRFEGFCRDRRVTPFIGLLCGLKILLYRLTGQTDLVVGTPAAGRPHPDLDNHIGLFINSLALRTRFDDDTSFDDLLASVRQTALAAFEHGAYPFDQLVADLAHAPDPSRSPLYDVMLSLVEQERHLSERLGDLTVGTVETDFDTAKLDLSFDFLRAGDIWQFSIEYNSDLFDPETAHRFGGRLIRILDHMATADRPDHRTLALAPPEELSTLRAPLSEAGEKDLHEPVSPIGAFIATAERYPDRPALHFRRESWSYAELDQFSGRLARALTRLPRFKPGQPVALLAPRDARLPAAILALLRSGAIYLPIDPDYPEDRVRLLLREAGPRHVLADDAWLPRVQSPSRRVTSLDDWWAAAAALEPLPWREPNPENTAYLMFTSGSTGVPKGVAVSHANFGHTLGAATAALTIENGPEPRMAWLASHAFDISLFELLLPLTRGAALEVLTREDLLDLDNLVAALARMTAFHAVPVLLDQILNHLGPDRTLDNLRWVFTGGDRVPAELLDRAEQAFPGARVLEFYGPTETTIICTTLDVRAEAAEGIGESCIGRPLPGVEISLRDRHGNVVPKGCVGEIHIAGPGVTPGYWRKPQLTAERFVVDGTGHRRYRTGDLARCLSNELLIYHGRADHQVKIRGIRIEPGEIEAHLTSHPKIRAAAVAPRQAKGKTQLAAYLVRRDEGSTESAGVRPDQLRGWLSRKVSEAMVPTLWFFLDELPRDPNGKLDRKALDRLEPEPANTTAGAVKQPASDVETKLRDIWCEVLQREDIGVDDHFTEVGGHSLELTQVALRIQRVFGRKLGIRTLIAYPTIETLAAQIESALPATAAEDAEPALESAPNTDYFKATADQERLWVLSQFEEASRAYHLPATYRFRGDLDEAAFERAFQTLCQRHPLLGSRFESTDSGPYVRTASTAIHLETIDLCEDPDVGTKTGEIIQNLMHGAFDLTTGPLVRVLLIRAAAGEWVLGFNLHHTIADGWSMGVLLADWWYLYRAECGAQAPLPPLTRQFADYAHHTSQARTRNRDRDLAWWLERFPAPPAPLALVTDRPRPNRRAYRGDQLAFPIEPALWKALVHFAESQAVTPFAVLMAGVYGWAHRHSGQTDITFGSPVSGRDREEWEGIVGLFVNTLALRLQIDPEAGFAALAKHVAAELEGAQAHGSVGFAELVERVNPPRDPSRSPLFDVLVSMFSKDGELPPGWSMEPADYRTSQFDLSFQFGRETDRWVLYLEYDADLFDQATVETFAARWAALMEAWLAAPQAHLVDPPLIDAPACAPPAPQTDAAARSLPRHETPLTRILDRAGREPNRIALQRGDQTLSYGDWVAAAERLATRLTPMLAEATDPIVAVAMPRDARLAVVMLAIWRCGAAYQPLTSDLPDARRELLLADSGADLLVCTEETRPDKAPCAILSYEDLPAQAGVSLPQVPRDPEALAYLIHTSGSTGRPKGVRIGHAALFNFLQSMAHQPGLAESDLVAAVTPVSFDISVLEWWLPAFVGARVEITTREELLADPAILEMRGVTLLQSTPANLALLLEAGWRGYHGLRVLCGGEALPMPLARILARHVKVLWNMYGPTETTVWSACTRITGEESRIHVGGPIDHTHIHLLDDRGRGLPAGIRGEIAIGGAGLAEGYHDRPDLTETAFAVSPQIPELGRLYRTGDLGYRDGGGNLVVLGRRDHQIKHKGHRIEPGEIEAILTSQAEVAQAAVLLQGTAPDTVLTAYIALSEGYERHSAAELRQPLTRLLPSYMVPQRWVAVTEMPLNTSGKIDRAALAAIPNPASEPEAEAATLSDREHELAALWGEVGVPDAQAPQAHFFERGGNSLKAVRLLGRLREHFAAAPSLADLFLNPTLAEQAALIDAAQAIDVTPIERVAEAAHYPATPSQQAIWQHERLQDPSTAYLLAGAYRLRGPLDGDRLATALARVAANQESLRTGFVDVHGEAAMVVAPSVVLPWRVEDLRDADDAELRARAISEEEAGKPFDLTQAPLFRARLLILDEADHLLLVTLHHLIADAWSLDLLLSDWLAAYRDLSSGGRPAPPPAWRFRDYAAHQHARRQSDAGRDAAAWWRNTLADPPDKLDLPTDRPYPDPSANAIPDRTGATCQIELSAELHHRLTELGRAQGTTQFQTLLAATFAFLYRYTGNDDLMMGTVHAGRNRPEWESMIGMFVQTLPLRAQVQGDQSFAALLDAVRTHALDAFEYADLAPSQEMEDQNASPTEMSASPVALPPLQVVMVLQNTEAGPGWAALGPDGIEVAAEELDTAQAKFDLAFHFSPTPSGLRLSVEYATALFEAETMTRWLRRFASLLEQVAADPSRTIADYDMLSPARKAEELANLQRVAQLEPPKDTLIARFESIASRNRDHVALVDGDRRWTYGDIDRLSRRIASQLSTRCGVGRRKCVCNHVCGRPGPRVGLHFRRRGEMVIAMLGILRAGAAYVPLDPDYPAERLAFFAKDARLTAWIGDDSENEALGKLPRLAWSEAIEEVPEDHEMPERQDGEAYIIYTSGSTGKPKGVPIRDSQVSSLLDHAQPHFQFGSQDVWTLFHSVSFDFSVWEIFGALLHGGTLVVVPSETARDAGAFAALLRRERVTILNQIPSAFAALCAEEVVFSQTLPNLRAVIFGGEALNPVTLQGFAANHPDCRLINMYGITETCVHVTFRELDGAALASGLSDIGNALPHLAISLLGPNGEWVPDGAAGEICVSGLGVARGYLNQRKLSMTRFTPHPAREDVTIYHSGDRARRANDGRLIYLGRADHQVKVRGYRIECGEIEAALLTIDGVSEAMVLVAKDAHGNGTLVAYLIGRDEGPDPRQVLRETLPSYMIPNRIHWLAQFPRTPSGKIDRAALPDPFATTEAQRPPQTPMEIEIAAIWREILNLRHVPGQKSHFFELGGHSLSALRVCRRIQQRCARTVTPRVLFETPALEDFAALVETLSTDENATEAPIPRLPDQDDYALSPQQERLWLLSQTRQLVAAYHVTAAFELEGTLDAEWVADAIQHLVDRHRALRTRFVTRKGLPRAHVVDRVDAPITLGHRAQWRRERALSWATEPFQLTRAPLLRALILHEENRVVALWLCAHHLVVDGWSMEQLQRDFWKYLLGRESGDSQSPIATQQLRYEDYANWLRAKEGPRADLWRFWNAYLDEAWPVLQLPQDRPRTAQPDFAGGHVRAALDPAWIEAFQTRARTLGVSDFSFHLTLLALTMARLSGQMRISVGAPVAGRPRLDLEDLVGFFVNTLPLRIALDGEESLTGLLRRVHRDVLGALDHQLYPFDQMVEDRGETAEPGRSPFFDVMLVFQNQDGQVAMPERSEVRAKPIELPTGGAKFDLTWTLETAADGWLLDLEYRTALFSETTAEGFMRAHLELLSRIVEDPEAPVTQLIQVARVQSPISDELDFELDF